MKDSIIDVQDVWKIYEMGESQVFALKGLTLNINKGEFVSVQGPSGSGKSTAMNMIGCLDLPTKGRIMLEKDDISKLSETELSNIRGRKIGFVFQQFHLIPTLSAKENVMLPLMFLGIPEHERIDRAELLLNEVGLQDRMDHRPNQLSGGQQQRVAIARALAADPEMILADEPTGNLDSKTGEAIMNYLEKLHKAGKTIVLVTHDERVAKRADRTEFLMDGKVIKKTKNR